MKKRLLPISLFLVIMVLGQTMAIADQGGHYVPRTQGTMNSESFMGSLRVNQHTGLIDPADMFKAAQTPTLKNRADDPLYWINMGPDNMGGQTTAILYDNTKNSHGYPNGVVYIGSKGGGVYKTYNYGITWHQVGNVNMMVSCMVQDKDGVIYVGTGDGGSAATYNGLSQQSYSNSFIGTGLYTIEARNNDALTQIVAPTAETWLYVNDLAIAGNTLVAATNDGLKYSTDKGQTWTVALEGVADEVRVCEDNTIVASVAGMIYIGDDIDNLECHCASTMQTDSTGIIALPKASGLYDIAVSPTNKNLIYAAAIGSDGNHTGIYVSENQGQTWAVALPSITTNLGHNVYSGYGTYNHGLVIDPSDENVVYVLGYNLWRLRKPETGGNYVCEIITSNGYVFDEDYLHVGLHALVFNPNNANECYVGTDGGIFKGTGRFTFKNSNRNYITTRMFNVAPSGKDTRILAAGLDHGTVKIEGDESSNTVGDGLWINPTGDIMGAFSEDSQAGPCAISAINPNTFFVTYKAGGLARTETAGEDWVSSNFTSGLTISTTSLRMPILLYENYDDATNPATVWYFNTTDATIPANTTVHCVSNNHYPFECQLTAPLAAGDSIEVHDPVGAKFFVAFKDVLYMTHTPLDFSVEAEWLKLSGKQLAGFAGEPLCMAITADGDNLFVGMKDGKFYRVSNINTALDAETGTYTTVDSTNHTILNPDCLVTTTTIELPIDGQCVTSVSVDPRDNNKVIVTCGNYGNDNYVFYSSNAMAENPTFNSVQGNLPKMPVYSSVIEMATRDVIIGTERGIFRTKSIASGQWTPENTIMGEIPVMELKQQVMYHEDVVEVEETEDGVFETVYPGVYNTGVIYAATYGRGIFRCENYKKAFTSVPETPSIEENHTVSMYPNPVRSEAVVSFEANGADVNYQVFDMTGRMVMSQNMGRFAAGSQEIRINAESLGTGSYILRLNQGDNTSCVKFLVY